MRGLADLGPGGVTYAAAGVSIEAGDEAVARISRVVDATRRPEVLGGIGGFAGRFVLDVARYRDPVLVASADGVGTKLEVARRAGDYSTVGLDLVAMPVDDLVCVGAEPLFLLDYVAVGELVPARLADLVAGVAEGCRLAGAALLGGETAEHGGVMAPDELDLAGFAVGVVERDEQWGPERVRSSDRLVALASPGLRSNGYSLARRVLLDGDGDLGRPAWPGAPVSLKEELLRPSVIYAPHVRALAAAHPGAIHAVSHVTGGGLVGNLPRVLPEGWGAVVERDAIETPEIFLEIQRRGRIATEEMLRVFNCGVGMVLVVAAEAAEGIAAAARAAGLGASVAGRLEPGAGVRVS